MEASSSHATSSRILSATNDRLSMTVSFPASGSFIAPGLVLAEVDCKEPTRYSSFDLTFTATANCTIMGKMRWQVGQAVNAGMGAGGVLVTTPESIEFIKVPGKWVAPPTNPSGASTDKKGVPIEGMAGRWQIDVPAVPDGQLLPSCERHEGLQADPAGIHIVYRLKLVAHRPGRLKRAERHVLLPAHVLDYVTDMLHSLSLVLPFAQKSPLPRPPPPTALQKALKFNGAPNLEIRFSYDYEAPRFVLCDVFISPAKALQLLENGRETVVQVALNRRARTTPVRDPSKGDSFQWAPAQVFTAPLDRHQESLKRPSTDNNAVRWRGKVAIPEQECTIESPTIGVDYTISCAIHDKSLEGGYAKTSLPIFLPSTTWDLADQPERDGDELPSYGET